MRQIKNNNLAQLLMQLRFTPQRQRRKQLDFTEKLLAIIDRNKEYPFEFVFFRITGFHSKDLLELEPIKGEELAEDLQIFISKLSGQVAQHVAEQNQKVCTIDELAAAFDVSIKTIGRWRKRGLSARKFIFSDGKKRLGFLQSNLDKFLKQNPDFTARARNFKRLTKKEKEQVIKHARALAAKTTLSRYQITEQIAAKTGRAHETIRYTLLNYDKAYPDKPISYEPPGVIRSAESAELYKLFKQGCDVKELMRRFGRSRSSIYRIVNRRRARALLARKIEFVASNEFLKENAREKILANPLNVGEKTTWKSFEPFELTSESLLPEYLQALKDAPVLNRHREVELFRRYNYFKYLACITRDAIKPANPSSAAITRYQHN